MQREGRDAGVVELLREHLGVRTRAGEHEGLAVAVDERGQDLCLVAVVDHENTVLDGARILVLASNLVDGGLDEELVDERGNFTVERRREQQLLTAVRGEAQDTLHRLEEAQLAHVVGFIQDRDPNLGEVEFALFDEVFDAARRADDDVDALLEGTDLARLRHATVDLRREQADAAGDRLDRPVDLQRELTRGSENQSLGRATELTTASCLRTQNALHERGAKGDGLARAGAAAG